MNRSRFLVLALSTLLSLPALAGDTVTYVAEMTGIGCAACKAHITESFKKLQGVSNVEFASADKPETHKVTVTSSAASLTKEQAVATLGDSATQYVVVSWAKK